MPFPTTVYVSRTIRSPALQDGTLVEHVARRLRAAGLAGVSGIKLAALLKRIGEPA